MKHELSVWILIPTLAGYTVQLKQDALSLCFISAACFSAFIAVPTNTENFYTLF